MAKPLATAQKRIIASGARRYLNRLIGALPLIILVGLLAQQAVKFALSNPLCCADDAAIANVAKSVASGNGYALPIDFNGASGRFPFNPNISTGPTLVLPAAAAIAVFGADPRVPGLTKAVVSIFLLCWILIEVICRVKYSRGVAYGILFVVLLFLATTGANFVQWYALIGELVAALLIILSALYVATTGSGVRAVTIGGLCLSLAILTKLLALLTVLPITLFAIYEADANSILAINWRRLSYFAVGLVLPLILFACWQFISLGAHGSEKWFSTLLYSVHHQVQIGGSSDTPLGGVLASRVAGNVVASVDSYSHSVVDTIVGVGLFSMVAASYSATSAGVKRFVCCLAVVAAVNLGWWLFFVSGSQWSRYALIGVILSAACVACVPLVQMPALWKWLGVICAVCMVAPVMSPSQVVWGGLSPPTAEGAERIAALRDAIKPLEDRAGSVLVGSWWASLVAPKYLLPADVPVVAFNKVSTVSVSYHRYLLLNNKWDSLAHVDKDPSFLAFKSHCGDVISRNRFFTLLACRQ